MLASFILNESARALNYDTLSPGTFRHPLDAKVQSKETSPLIRTKIALLLFQVPRTFAINNVRIKCRGKKGKNNKGAINVKIKICKIVRIRKDKEGKNCHN